MLGIERMQEETEPALPDTKGLLDEETGGGMAEIEPALLGLCGCMERIHEE
jgi:hypothetical protein